MTTIRARVTVLRPAVHERVGTASPVTSAEASLSQKLACLMSTEYVVALRSHSQRAQLAAELRVRYESGASIRALAESTHLAYGTVRRLLIEANAPLRSRGGTYSGARTDLVTRIRGALELLGDTLPQHLLNVAQLRLEYPEATIVQLAATARPPLSAGAVYMHLRTVLRLAEAVRRANAHAQLRQRRSGSVAPRLLGTDE